MGHAGQRELRLRIEPFTVKTVKQRGRCGAVEATIMKAETYFSHRRTGGHLSQSSNAERNKAFYNGGSHRESQ
jgi:hypothetical protein